LISREADGLPFPAPVDTKARQAKSKLPGDDVHERAIQFPAKVLTQERPQEHTSRLFSTESVLRLQKLIFAGSPLSEVLTNIAQLVESQADGMLCTIWAATKPSSIQIEPVVAWLTRSQLPLDFGVLMLVCVGREFSGWATLEWPQCRE